MPISDKRMPLLSHLGELRRRIAIIAILLGVLTMGLYVFTDPIFGFLVRPVAKALHGQKPIAIDVLGPMTMRFSLAFWSAVVLTSPVIIWQTMAFFLPGLRPKERKWVVPTFIAMVVLFVIGVVFCYLVILGPSFGWLADQAGSIIAFTPQASDAILVIEFFLLGFGIAFQLPVIVFYLVYFGVIPYSKLRENWRFVYVGLVIAAAMITPDFSPVSMGALAIAMIVLYEVSLALCRVLLARRIKARELSEAEA